MEIRNDMPLISIHVDGIAPLILLDALLETFGCLMLKDSFILLGPKGALLSPSALLNLTSLYA